MKLGQFPDDELCMATVQPIVLPQCKCETLESVANFEVKLNSSSPSATIAYKTSPWKRQQKFGHGRVAVKLYSIPV